MEGGIEIFQIWWQLGLGIWVFSVHVRFSSDAIWDEYGSVVKRADDDDDGRWRILS